MQIFIITLSNKNILLDITVNDTIINLKEKIMEKENIPISQQRLIFSGKHLCDDKKITDYDIKNNNTLTLMFRLLGGEGMRLHLEYPDRVVSENKSQDNNLFIDFCYFIAKIIYKI